MRAFIGIELSEETKSKLATLKEQCASLTKDEKWHIPENYHLTLRYLGEISSETEAQVQPLLNDLAKNYASFDLIIEGIGSFPKRSSFVLWAGVRTNPILQALHSQLEEKLEKQTLFQAEKRPYTPHITLARKAKLKKSDTDLSTLNYSPITTSVSYLTLFESTRIDGTLRYVPRFRVPLKPNTPSFK